MLIANSGLQGIFEDQDNPCIGECFFKRKLDIHGRVEAFVAHVEFDEDVEVARVIYLASRSGVKRVINCQQAVLWKEFFEHPIPNSLYERPAWHWELDENGQPTGNKVNDRRRADFVTPISKPKETSAA